MCAPAAQPSPPLAMMWHGTLRKRSVRMELFCGGSRAVVFFGGGEGCKKQKKLGGGAIAGFQLRFQARVEPLMPWRTELWGFYGVQRLHGSGLGP